MWSLTRGRGRLVTNISSPLHLMPCFFYRNHIEKMRGCYRISGGSVGLVKSLWAGTGCPKHEKEIFLSFSTIWMHPMQKLFCPLARVHHKGRVLIPNGYIKLMKFNVVPYAQWIWLWGCIRRSECEVVFHSLKDTSMGSLTSSLISLPSLFCLCCTLGKSWWLRHMARELSSCLSGSQTHDKTPLNSTLTVKHCS